MKTRKLSYEDWYRKASAICNARYGTPLEDLPDCPYRDWYDAGYTPAGAARRAVDRALSD